MKIFYIMFFVFATSVAVMGQGRDEFIEGERHFADQLKSTLKTFDNAEEKINNKKQEKELVLIIGGANTALRNLERDIDKHLNLKKTLSPELQVMYRFLAMANVFFEQKAGTLKPDPMAFQELERNYRAIIDFYNSSQANKQKWKYIGVDDVSKITEWHKHVYESLEIIQVEIRCVDIIPGLNKKLLDFEWNEKYDAVLDSVFALSDTVIRDFIIVALEAKKAYTNGNCRLALDKNKEADRRLNNINNGNHIKNILAQCYNLSGTQIKSIIFEYKDECCCFSNLHNNGLRIQNCEYCHDFNKVKGLDHWMKRTLNMDTIVAQCEPVIKLKTLMRSIIKYNRDFPRLNDQAVTCSILKTQLEEIQNLWAALSIEEKRWANTYYCLTDEELEGMALSFLLACDKSGAESGCEELVNEIVRCKGGDCDDLKLLLLSCIGSSKNQELLLGYAKRRMGSSDKALYDTYFYKDGLEQVFSLPSETILLKKENLDSELRCKTFCANLNQEIQTGTVASFTEFSKTYDDCHERPEVRRVDRVAYKFLEAKTLNCGGMGQLSDANRSLFEYYAVYGKLTTSEKLLLVTEYGIQSFDSQKLLNCYGSRFELTANQVVETGDPTNAFDSLFWSNPKPLGRLMEWRRGTTFEELNKFYISRMPGGFASSPNAAKQTLSNAIRRTSIGWFVESGEIAPKDLKLSYEIESSRVVIFNYAALALAMVKSIEKEGQIDLEKWILAAPNQVALKFSQSDRLSSPPPDSFSVYKYPKSDTCDYENTETSYIIGRLEISSKPFNEDRVIVLREGAIYQFERANNYQSVLLCGLTETAPQSKHLVDSNLVEVRYSPKSIGGVTRKTFEVTLLHSPTNESKLELDLAFLCLDKGFRFEPFKSIATPSGFFYSYSTDDCCQESVHGKSGASVEKGPVEQPASLVKKVREAGVIEIELTGFRDNQKDTLASSIVSQLLSTAYVHREDDADNIIQRTKYFRNLINSALEYSPYSTDLVFRGDGWLSADPDYHISITYEQTERVIGNEAKYEDKYNCHITNKGLADTFLEIFTPLNLDKCQTEADRIIATYGEDVIIRINPEPY